ncbi:hypothetical protein ARMGADRAFT_1008628 [Armillaria gallica]|uniref:Uncharacterized protein n=1 Tax=Armillaria gallica TaxID=47427 RepID=A0A2H3DVP6_ARMGA|nr:hypothetical protein ARMGADRAFT_1008628 [Armillaria gallica]
MGVSPHPALPTHQAVSMCLCGTPPFPSQNRPQRRLFKLTRVPRCKGQHASGSRGQDEVIMAESNQMRTRNSSPCRRFTVTSSKSLFPSPLVEDHCIQVEHDGHFLNSWLPHHLGSHSPCD